MCLVCVLGTALDALNIVAHLNSKLGFLGDSCNSQCLLCTYYVLSIVLRSVGGISCNPQDGYFTVEETWI